MRLLRFLFGVLLLPVCVAVTYALVEVVASIPSSETGVVPASAWALLGGVAAWLAVYGLLPAPVRTYVLAHELTHALWGVLMGARVSRMRVSKDGGSVTLSDSNFLSTLAPYFFPLYTALVIVAYYVASLFRNVEPWYILWLGLVGFTWGFHLTFTVRALLRQQSDIREYGRAFSYAVIYIFNVLGVGLWVVAVSSATLDGLLHGVQQGLLLVLDVSRHAAVLIADGLSG